MAFCVSWGLVAEPTPANSWSPDQLKFQAWLALPKAARTPKTQKELARLLEHDPGTLSDWKLLPGFNDAVYDLAMDVIRGELVSILHAHVKIALEDLDSAKWVFELLGKWSPSKKGDQGNQSPPIKGYPSHLLAKVQ